jgi:hypothetical protein
MLRLMLMLQASVVQKATFFYECEVKKGGARIRELQ